MPGRILVFHHNVLAHVPVHSQPVEAGVVRVSVIVVYGELHQVPPRVARPGQPECLYGVSGGGVGEVEEGRDVLSVLSHA